TDDDCSPQPEWLSALNLGLEEFDIVQGRVEPDPSQWSQMGSFTRSIGIGGENGFYETCNIGYRRDVLERMGGFDEKLRWAGEETDLGCRARASGATYRFSPE